MGVIIEAFIQSGSPESLRGAGQQSKTAEYPNARDLAKPPGVRQSSAALDSLKLAYPFYNEEIATVLFCGSS
jgi:hypothetical protein